jgi:hypothetical protein
MPWWGVVLTVVVSLIVGGMAALYWIGHQTFKRW